MGASGSSAPGPPRNPHQSSWAPRCIVFMGAQSSRAHHCVVAHRSSYIGHIATKRGKRPLTDLLCNLSVSERGVKNQKSHKNKPKFTYDDPDLKKNSRGETPGPPLYREKGGRGRGRWVRFAGQGEGGRFAEGGPH